MDIFDYDAELDHLMDHPFPSIKTDPNVTVETVYYGPEYGNVLRLERTGPVTLGPTHSAYLGHDLTGVFRVSFDFNVTDVDAATGVTQFLIRLGSSSGTSDSRGASWIIGTDSRHVVLNKLSTGALEDNRWYHVDTIIDMRAGTITDYLDGEHRETRKFTGEIPPHYSYISITQYPNDPEITRILGIYLDNIRISVPAHTVQPIASADGSSSLSITFDDVYANVYDVARPIMGDMPAAVAVTTEWIEGTKPGHMTWAQVRELYDSGWEILGHGTSHPDMTTLTEEELHAEYKAVRDAIAQNTGIKVKGWAYPFQASNAASDAVGWQYYEYLGHTTQGMTRLAIYSTDYGDNVAMERLKAALVYGSNAHISVYTHQILDGSATSNTDVRSFTEFVQWLRDNEINVVTPYEGYIPYRNAAMAQVSGNATEFSIGYRDDIHNYANDDVMVRIAGHDDGDYVIVDELGRSTRATSTDGYMIATLGAGSYTVQVAPDDTSDLTGYGWVIAGLAGCAALAAYIMGYRHPVILAIAAILLIAAALMHYGVL